MLFFLIAHLSLLKPVDMFYCNLISLFLSEKWTNQDLYSVHSQCTSRHHKSLIQDLFYSNRKKIFEILINHWYFLLVYHPSTSCSVSVSMETMMPVLILFPRLQFLVLLWSSDVLKWDKTVSFIKANCILSPIQGQSSHINTTVAHLKF